MIDDVIVVFEDPVREPVVAHVSPNNLQASFFAVRLNARAAAS
jgi:hypothetical protein